MTGWTRIDDDVFHRQTHRLVVIDIANALRLLHHLSADISSFTSNVSYLGRMSSVISGKSVKKLLFYSIFCLFEHVFTELQNDFNNIIII